MNRPSASLIHDAFVYSGDDELVETAVPFLRGGLEAGEPCVVIAPEGNRSLLRDALGGDERRMSFMAAESWRGDPSEIIAGYHDALLDHLGGGAKRVRVLGEVGAAAAPRDAAAWLRFESSFNRIFESFPAWVVCPYDTRHVPPRVAEDARRTHPFVIAGGRRYASEAFIEPKELLARTARGRGAPPSGHALVACRVAAASELRALRRAIYETSTTVGMPADRAEALSLATNEVATNALVHGGGRAIVTVWTEEGAWHCDVVDTGSGIGDVTTGSLPPGVRESGMGLWIARQVCDDVAMFTSTRGLLVRLTVRLAHTEDRTPAFG